MNGEVVGCEIGGVPVDVIFEATYRREDIRPELRHSAYKSLTLDQRYG
jgi:hypothetical protein